MTGGVGTNSGKIESAANLGVVTIAGNVVGTSDFSAGIFAGGNFRRVVVGGALRGGAGQFSGFIGCLGNLGSARVTGNIEGGGGTASASLVAGKRIASVWVGGSILGGAGLGAGSIRAGDNLGTMTIRHNLVGTVTNPVIISGRGQAIPSTTSDIAITRIYVGGWVEFANILAGYDAFQVPVNADAQIGTITVAGNWRGGCIVAGVHPGLDWRYGTADDLIIAGGSEGITARIGAITLGQAQSTPGSGDNFGIVSEAVGSLTIGGVPRVLKLGPHNDDFLVSPTDDLRLHEL